MEKKKIKIKSINIKIDTLNIIDDNEIRYQCQILKGSINFLIYNEDNQEVNISNIEPGDIVKILYENKVDLWSNMINGYF